MKVEVDLKSKESKKKGLRRSEFDEVFRLKSHATGNLEIKNSAQ